MAALLLAVAAAAQQPPFFGRDTRIGPSAYHPVISFHLENPAEPDPELYRRVETGHHGERLQTGRYPAPAFAARAEGNVRLRLEIDGSGRPGSCAVIERSGNASLDNHACPHVIRYAIFHPALDSNGRRRGGTVTGVTRYQLVARPSMTMFRPGDPEIAQIAHPSRPIDAATIGITPATPRPPGVSTVSGVLAVSAEGSVTACTLREATFDDSFDRGVCDRLRGLAFEPARDRRRAPIASTASFWVRWPDAGR
ncbi:MAG: periplasmic protein TonB [Sphingomonadales bacterium]|jgi:TonB family protein|nr:periplasmic protein TonB [Sphingomonadales bacterium]